MLTAEMYKLAESYTINLAIFAEKTKHMDSYDNTYQSALDEYTEMYNNFMDLLTKELNKKDDDNDSKFTPRIEL